MNKDTILKINKRSFITVCLILVSFMLLSYMLTFFIKKGVYEELNYIELEGKGYSLLKFIFSPIRLLASSDGIVVIVISLFILILGGSFNVMDKTNGVYTLIGYLISKFKTKKYILMYLVILFFMLFGSLFGIFEESVTLLPIIILLALSLGWDTFTGFGMCVMAAGFGFSTAITNPFSIGLASEKMGITIIDGIWYRLIIFVIMYILLCTFLTLHVKKIEKSPEKSLTYEEDQEKIKSLNLNDFKEYNPKVLRAYSILYVAILVIMLICSLVDALKGYATPVLALSFLIGIFICGLAIGYKFKDILKMFIDGLISISPAIILLLLAGSIKYILEDSQIMDTIIYSLSNMLNNTSPIVGILFIYAIILFIQFFIGSASAKVILTIPIISLLASKINITQNIALLAFVFGDGYTDLIYPTNPVLLISLGIAGISYPKWVKKTIGLQLILLLLTVIFLIIGYYIGY